MKDVWNIEKVWAHVGYPGNYYVKLFNSATMTVWSIRVSATDELDAWVKAEPTVQTLNQREIIMRRKHDYISPTRM